MERTIALYLHENNDMASFSQAGKIAIYRRRAALWSQASEFPIPGMEGETPAAQRTRARRVIEALGPCRVVAGLSLTGISYHEFDRAGFHIFNISDFGPEIFEEIFADIQAAGAEIARQEDVLQNTRPVETGMPGVYRLDLTVLQREYPQISSKMALQEFLAQTPFVELHLICAHLPPWLENGAYDIQVRREDGNLHAVIAKKVCGGGCDDGA